MLRIDEMEVLDDPELSDAEVERAYRDMAAIHRWLGDVRFMVHAIRSDSRPVRRVLDVGCGTGLILQRVSRALSVDAIGADIRPHLAASAPVPIVEADACADLLPSADVAFSMYLGHHLDPESLVRLIRNVGRSCRRFILLDLVRHPLPLALFKLFVAPLICPIDAQDGWRSIRRSYTHKELSDIAAVALSGSGATFRSSVAPFYFRQIVDITYEPLNRERMPGRKAITDENQCLL